MTCLPLRAAHLALGMRRGVRDALVQHRQHPVLLPLVGHRAFPPPVLALEARGEVEALKRHFPVVAEVVRLEISASPHRALACPCRGRTAGPEHRRHPGSSFPGVPRTRRTSPRTEAYTSPPGGSSAPTAATPAMSPACATTTRSGRPPLPRNVRNATGSPLGPASCSHWLPAHAPASTLSSFLVLQRDGRQDHHMGLTHGSSFEWATHSSRGPPDPLGSRH